MADIVLKDRVYPEVAGWADELTAIRHEIHQHPEPRLETAETAARIVRILKGWGLTDIDDRLVRNGVVVRIEGNRPGAVIGLRADIDALKMDDQSVNPWKSLKPGLAHTCGHDGHQTWLMGALRYLHLHRDFPGTVIGIFQPAEEIAEGAKAVVASGVFEKYGIQEILGAHDERALPKGVFGMKSGPLQASSDNFFIKVIGKGTHGGRPHQGLDPIPVGCQIVSDVQTIISRRINPADPAVISICSLNAGKYELTNVVPGVLTMSGTVRTFNPEVRALIKEKLPKTAKGIAEANDLEAEVEYRELIPPVINDPKLTAACVETATVLFGPDHVKTDLQLIMGAEDFSLYQQKVPGLMMRVGIRDDNHTATLHNPTFDFNDEVLPAAVTLFAALAKSRLEALSK